MFERENSSNESLKAFDIKAEDSGDKQLDKDNKDLKGKNRSKIVLLLVVVGILLGIGIVYSIIDPDKAATSLVKDESSSMFLPMEEITVNLRNNGDGSNTWLRIKVSLELQGQSNYDMALKMMPKIVDVFQTYLKELRKTDLDGSFGIYKMKDEMTMRINTILYPISIRGIFFQEVIMQTN